MRKSIDTYINFNSIKVQLRRLTKDLVLFPVTDFNSIKVQLRQLEDIKNRASKTFQFHKGTIKTRMVRDFSLQRKNISIP